MRLIAILILSLNIVICNLTGEKIISEVVKGLTEIINGLKLQCLTILVPNYFQNDDIVDDLIFSIHELNIKTCIFFSQSKFLEHIENNIIASIESHSLIFAEPYKLINEIQNKNLAHRLCIYIFFWGAKSPPKSSAIQFEERIRAVIITNPRPKTLRVYYNQATSTRKSNLHLVNWYDGDSMGLYKLPLLPSSADVYSNFQGRIFYVPVIHSPPWFFVEHFNDTENITFLSELADYDYNDVNLLKVIGGRDHHLLSLISKKMNFKFQYVDPPGRTQGNSIANGIDDEHLNFTGAIGMIQKKQAHLLLGDVGLSWERRKAVEFSFFTLADSGAFAAHAPKRLNEALALIRPFQPNVWPYLIITVLLSGPILYASVNISSYWDPNYMIIYPEYIMEMTLQRNKKPIKKRKIFFAKYQTFGECIWLTVQIFLNQTCSAQSYQSYKARFLIIVYWIVATYILAAVYSAQLTSQFARPARESPIDTLEKLEYAMKYYNYQLYVEKDSSSLEILENSTEIFRRLYKLMKQQGESGYFVNSVQEAIQMISDDSEKVIFAGRETLYYNIKQNGIKNFQLSYKLYTRYSAVATQIGCPFLDSLNDILMRLFESGIIDKITNDEYDKMSSFQLQNDENNDEIRENVDKEKTNQFQPNDAIIEPINLRMIQGAFIILLIGSSVACIALLIEIYYLKFFGRFSGACLAWK